MATQKQVVVRLDAHDVAILDGVRRDTGYVTMSDTLRHVLRQYAALTAEQLEDEKKRPARTKKSA